MADFRYLVGGLGFSLIVIFSFVLFYSEGANNYSATSTLNLSSLEKYDDFMLLVNEGKNTTTINSGVNIDAGQIIYRGGISFLQNIITGKWLILLSSLIVESLGLSMVPNIQIIIFTGIIVIVLISIVISIFMGRDV